MKTGYPFLAISKIHNVDYGAVLTAAHYLKQNPGYFAKSKAVHAFEGLNGNLDCLRAIDNANYEFAAMQAGIIQWQAGHEVKEAA